MFFQTSTNSLLNLQSTLSASSSNGEIFPGGHHPITCSGPLFFEEDGSFKCGHSTADPMDVRTQTAINHSIAILLFEILADSLKTK